MTKQLLNSEIIYTLSKMGHTDKIVICDCGLPIPDSVNRIDISLKKDSPSFFETLDILLSEFTPETIFLAKEIVEISPEFHKEFMKKVAGIKVEYISHEELKRALPSTKACIRTGECTPFANAILQMGSIF